MRALVLCLFFRRFWRIQMCKCFRILSRKDHEDFCVIGQRRNYMILEKVLGLNRFPHNQMELQHAYRQSIMAYHPDKTDQSDQSQKEYFSSKMSEINEAYKIMQQMLHDRTENNIN